MSRSGYIDDCDDDWAAIRWRGAVKAAIRGRRGQALLLEMRDALKAMPEKLLIANELVCEDGACCALGAVALRRGINVSGVDPEESEVIAGIFGVAEALVKEIVYENDEGGWNETPEQRWSRMLRWVERHIEAPAAAEAAQQERKA